MNQPNSYISLQINAQGQFTLPVVLQQALNIQTGDTLLAYLENNRLIIEKNQTIKQKLKARFKHVPESLADELIASRRKEAVMENT